MSATIHYHDIGDYLSREEKLKIQRDSANIPIARSTNSGSTTTVK